MVFGICIDMDPESDRQKTDSDYKNVLRRGLGYVSTSCLGFNSVAVLTGIAVTYGEGLLTGGPVVILWGWVFAFDMSLIVSFSMAEICAAYPFAGGIDSLVHIGSLIDPTTRGVSLDCSCGA